MKKLLYLFTLIALSVGLTCAQAASPTYDDNPPPSYIWGEGEINSQTSGTPNKTGEQKIVDAINNMDIGVGSISVDTSNIESYLRVGDGQTATSTVTDLINGIGTDTTNIESNLKVDNKTVTELVNGIGTDTRNIESYLKKVDGNDTTSITDFIEEIKNSLKVSINPYDYSVIDRLIVLVSNSEDTKTEVASISHNIGNLLDDTITDFRTSRLSVSASTATQVSPLTNAGSTATKRVFVELRAIDPDDEFYIGFADTVTDSNGRPVKGRILLNMPSTQNLYIYHTNESALAVQQTEGWR